MIALSIALVIVSALIAWVWRDLDLRRLAAVETRAKRFDEAQARKARTAEAERLDALEAEVRRLDKIIVSRTLGGAKR